MFLRNNSNENWFVSSERPRKSTLVLFPRRTESSLAEAVYARRKIVCISHIVLRGKTKIALALHRQETTVQQSWDNEHVETELDKKRSFFFRWKVYFWQDQTYQISSIGLLDYWPLNLIYTAGFHNILQFTTNLCAKRKWKKTGRGHTSFIGTEIYFSRIADVTEGTIPKLSGYWHKL